MSPALRSVCAHVFLLLLPVIATGSSRAQRQRNTVSPAVVKIAVLAAAGGGRSGTGFIIDRQGYVLTSFRTIGHGDGTTGPVGSLYAADNRYLVATQEGAEARYRYVARVVRADVRKDVAVLQIIARLGGGSLRGVDFVSLAEGAAPPRGSAASIVGYPSGSSVPRTVSAPVSGLVFDAYRQPVFIETRGRIDSGMIGGPLLDSAGRFSGVATTPDGLVRPSNAVSGRWRDALRAGNVNDLRIEGVRTLGLGTPLPDATFAPPRPGSEWLYYRLPSSRPLNVRVEPALGLGVYAQGRAFASGRGSVAVESTTPSDAILAVEKPAEAAAFQIFAEPAATAQLSNALGRTSNSWIPGGGSAYVPRQTAATARIVGRMVDARTGDAVPNGTVIVSRQEVDLGDLLSRFLTGSIGERSFRRELAGSSTTARGGRFEIADLPPGRRYSIAGFAPGYRPAMLAAVAPPQGGTVTVPTLRMTR